MLTPKEIAVNYIAVSKAKVKMSVVKTVLLGIMAGIFIAFASVASNTALSTFNGSAARIAGACVFPGGLAMVIIAGSELFTGNNLMIIAALKKEITILQMLRNWGLVYLGNFIGSLLIAFLVVYSGQLSLFGEALVQTTINVANAKVTMDFHEAFLKGVLCNILVCTAVWMSFSTKSTAGKFIAIFMPIMMFVLCGFEHSVANMYYIPAGLLAKSCNSYPSAVVPESLTWGAYFLKNLLPVSLGNIVGGAGVVGAIYTAAYISKVSD